MNDTPSSNFVSLDTSKSIWSHFYTVAPLVVIGTKEEDHYDLAPKHMVTPLGYDNFFGFVCTPSHRTYHNIKKTGEFSVSFIRPNQVILASLAATPRCSEKNIDKEIVDLLPTRKAKTVDALVVSDSYLFFECKLDRIIDGFGDCSLIAGKIMNAFVHEDAFRESDGDDASMIYKMPMLAYLPYGRFAEIQETNAFPFPKDFRIENIVDNS